MDISRVFEFLKFTAVVVSLLAAFWATGGGRSSDGSLSFARTAPKGTTSTISLAPSLRSFK
jgi:hypothetical protein